MWEALTKAESTTTKRSKTPDSPSQLDWAAIGATDFYGELDDRFGVGRKDWKKTKESLAFSKRTRHDDPNEGLGPVTSFLLLPDGAARDHHFEILGLALEWGEITEADLPETVMLDDDDVTISLQGIAVPVGKDNKGRMISDTSRLRLVITSKLDSGSLPLELTVKQVTSGQYLTVSKRGIRRNLPMLYAKLERYGLFLGPDLTPHSKGTKDVLVHRLVKAAGGINVAGLEVDHKSASTGRWYGGPKTYDASFSATWAITKAEHTAWSIKRAEKDFNTDPSMGNSQRSAERSAEDLAMVREVTTGWHGS